MTELFLFIGILASVNYFILIKSFIMNLQEKDNTEKCSKCGMTYSANSEKLSIMNTGVCITCNAIKKGRP